jgi:hypothetical protein
VSANAKEEFMFLFSVKVMEEVKSDALYEFQPPFNIFAGLVVWPCSLFCPADVVGRISRALLRLFFFPELVCIWIFEVLVLRKQPQYVPVRPGVVEHERTYGATLSENIGKSSVGGGVAQRRLDRDNSATVNTMEGQSSRDSASPPEGARSIDATIFPNPGGPPPDGQLPTVRPSPQELLNLTTNGPVLPNEPNGQEIVSPYFENIRRFRDASKNNSTSSGSLKSDGENSQERSPYSHQPTMYSYQPTAPIGMAITRQGSMSGYGRARQSTEMTLANTFQGFWPHHFDIHAVNDSGTSTDPYHQHQQWQQQQEHLHHQQQQQPPPPNQQAHAPNQRWFMESSEGKQLLQQQQADTEELTRLVEDRFTEMRIRMEEIESKLDRLMGAVLGLQDL